MLTCTKVNLNVRVRVCACSKATVRERVREIPANEL